MDKEMRMDDLGISEVEQSSLRIEVRTASESSFQGALSKRSLREAKEKRIRLLNIRN